VLALLAALPILLVLALMLGLGWPASRAGIAGAALALVVAIAEPGGTVVTGDRADIEALAAHADRVSVEVI